ncbi:alpha-(1,3)-fucosyltransferase 7-like [Oratosquilla oratoria]|uniref:alpha-(1,3)-fucosyltransferase 7-like n=1 Tax=Oratosquilla oratoria TaxID=337810 RepID=UPI003F76F030
MFKLFKLSRSLVLWKGLRTRGRCQIFTLLLLLMALTGISMISNYLTHCKIIGMKILREFNAEWPESETLGKNSEMLSHPKGIIYHPSHPENIVLKDQEDKVLPLRNLSSKDSFGQNNTQLHQAEKKWTLNDRYHDNWRNLSDWEVTNLSVLGKILFLGLKISGERERSFTIAVWKHGKSIESRLIRQYGKKNNDPFGKCSVKNCKLTYNDTAVTKADAVLIHLHRTKGPDTLPERGSPSQRWIWLTDESPYHTFMSTQKYKLHHYNGLFNWSMSYRMDSDIPVPYGRTVPLSTGHLEALSKDYQNKTKLVAILISNCGGRNGRMAYVKELQKHINVDVYGKCGTLKCAGHYNKDCPAIDHYKFYLAFENSNCQEYLTEKVWWNALHKGAVPVVMGGLSTHDTSKILPPNSFIHVDDFTSPKQLATYLLYLSSNASAYNSHHTWRKEFTALNEHGYFGSDNYHYCRICEALNYNSPAPKVYNHLENFWSVSEDCNLTNWKDKLTPK